MGLPQQLVMANWAGVLSKRKFTRFPLPHRMREELNLSALNHASLVWEVVAKG